MAGKTEQDLLARLNALKSSTIDLDRKRSSPALLDADDGDDIAQRFLNLRSRGEVGSTQKDYDDEPLREDTDEVEDIDEMLREFSSKGKTSLAPGDQRRVEILLAQAQSAFADDDREQGHQAATTAGEHEAVNPGDHEKSEAIKDSNEDGSSVDDDAEADELLAQILAEVHFNINQAPISVSPSAEPGVNANGSASEPFEGDLFPTTPSKEPQLPMVPQADALELPSAPTSEPVKARSKTGMKRYTDSEIETWCEICQANAEVRCLGCDGELYCLRCWKEGHTGPDAGYEEKTHRCVQYSKPGSQAAAA